MENSPGFNLRFVQEVERQSCLYDYNSPYYNDRDALDNAWQTVSQAVGASGRQMFLHHLICDLI